MNLIEMVDDRLKVVGLPIDLDPHDVEPSISIMESSSEHDADPSHEPTVGLPPKENDYASMRRDINFILAHNCEVSAWYTDWFHEYHDRIWPQI